MLIVLLFLISCYTTIQAKDSRVRFTQINAALEGKAEELPVSNALQCAIFAINQKAVAYSVKDKVKCQVFKNIKRILKKASTDTVFYIRDLTAGNGQCKTKVKDLLADTCTVTDEDVCSELKTLKQLCKCSGTDECIVKESVTAQCETDQTFVSSGTDDCSCCPNDRLKKDQESCCPEKSIWNKESGCCWAEKDDDSDVKWCDEPGEGEAKGSCLEDQQ